MSARLTARTWLGASVVEAGAEGRVDAQSRSHHLMVRVNVMRTAASSRAFLIA
jgi:hypothetical protein